MMRRKSYQTTLAFGSLVALGLVGWLSPEGWTDKAPELPLALSTCQSFAQQQTKRDNPETFVSIALRNDNDVTEDKWEEKAGKQFISTVLSGTGQVQYRNEAPRDIRYTCLLESDHHAVFFYVWPNHLIK